MERHSKAPRKLQWTLLAGLKQLFHAIVAACRLRLKPSGQTKPNRSAFSERELIHLLEDLSKAYSDLTVPPGAERQILEKEWASFSMERGARLYVLATVSATFFFFSLPILLPSTWQVAQSANNLLLPYLDQSHYLHANPALLIGVVFAAFAAFCYAFVIPSAVVEKHLGWLEAPWGNIKRTTSFFRLYRLATLYFLIAVGIVLTHSFLPGARAYSAFLALLWIFVLTLPLIPFPTMLLLAALVIAFMPSARQRAPYASALREIMLLLRMLEDASVPGQLTMSQRHAALNRIAAASAALRELYGTRGARGRIALWTRERMDRVADNFLALSAWIAFPKKDSVETLKRRLVFYANILIAGTCDELPANPVDQSFPFIRYSPRRGYLRRLGSLIWILILVTLPLIIYVAISVQGKLDIPAPLQTPAAIAYSAWVAVCLLAHIERLAPEAKTTLLDVIKVVFRR